MRSRHCRASDAHTREPETVIVSSARGTVPRWAAGGNELHFISADGTVMVADVNAGASISGVLPIGNARYRTVMTMRWAGSSPFVQRLAGPAAMGSTSPLFLVWTAAAVPGMSSRNV